MSFSDPKTMDWIQLDLSAAFDTINQNFLLQRLEPVTGIKLVQIMMFPSYRLALVTEFHKVLGPEEGSWQKRTWTSPPQLVTG